MAGAIRKVTAKRCRISDMLARAFGCTGFTVENPADLDAGLERMLTTDGPVLVNALVPLKEISSSNLLRIGRIYVGNNI